MRAAIDSHRCEMQRGEGAETYPETSLNPHLRKPPIAQPQRIADRRQPDPQSANVSTRYCFEHVENTGHAEAKIETVGMPTICERGSYL